MPVCRRFRAEVLARRARHADNAAGGCKVSVPSAAHRRRLCPSLMPSRSLLSRLYLLSLSIAAGVPADALSLFSHSRRLTSMCDRLPTPTRVHEEHSFSPRCARTLGLEQAGCLW